MGGLQLQKPSGQSFVLLCDPALEVDRQVFDFRSRCLMLVIKSYTLTVSFDTMCVTYAKGIECFTRAYFNDAADAPSARLRQLVLGHRTQNDTSHYFRLLKRLISGVDVCSHRV